MAQIREGDLAPDIKFLAYTDGLISLRRYRGKKAVVVYFYPKNHTPICTREACAFRDMHHDFLEAGAVVIGVSSDSYESHHSFARSHGLPFLLVSDVDDKLRKTFGVPKTMGVLPGRVTYVIDKQGIVRRIFNAQFSGERHAEEALKIVHELVREPSEKGSTQ